MRSLLIAFLVVLSLSACQIPGGNMVAGNGSPGTSVAPRVASAVAGDLSGHVAERIRPSPSIAIVVLAEDREFATAMEAALKGWGYVVVRGGPTPPDKTAVELKGSIDSSDGQISASISTASLGLARTYRPSNEGAMPTGPLVITQRN
jgi:type IV secretion system protein TrbH